MLRNHSCFGDIEGDQILKGEFSVIVPQEDEQQLPPERIPHGLSLFPGGHCEYHFFYSCRAFSSWARPELFLPRNHHWR